jgi:hypothetical protein
LTKVTTSSGYTNAVGLQLYYDAVSQTLRFGMEIAPNNLQGDRKVELDRALRDEGCKLQRVADKCSASPALEAGSRGTIKTMFPFREAPACLSRPDGMAGELHIRYRRK